MDWRERLREPAQARPNIAAIPDNGVEGGMVAAASLRGGYTSNANADFAAAASPFVKHEHEILLRQPVGAAEGAVHLRGTIEKPHISETVAYNEFDAKAGLVARAQDGSALGLTGGYRLEDDRGLRSRDLGIGLEGTTRLGPFSPFFTATASRTVHDPLLLAGIPLDMSDNDRLGMGVEAGLAWPAGAGLTTAVSAGYVGQRYMEERDLLGFERSNDAVLGRARLSFAGDTLSWDVGAMLFARAYDDPLFPSTTVLLGEANLMWRPNEDTALRFRYLGDLEETPVYGVRDVQTDHVIATLARRVGAQVTATGAAYLERERYLGTERADLTRGLGLELARKLTDSASVDLALEYETMTSTIVDDQVDIWKISLGFTYAYAH